MITVAICTWNRARLLNQTLASMQALRIPEGVNWELIVVNNNCTDETGQVIAGFIGRLPIREVFESAQGLSHARNRAICEARGKYIIFTDDDILFDPEWLMAYYRAFERFPEASYFGGPIIARFDAVAPDWLQRNLNLLSSVYGIIDLGQKTQMMARETAFIPCGGNMAVKSQVLRDHQFNPDLGRKGSELILGEETSLFELLQAKGHRSAWVAEAGVQHRVPEEHLNLDYIWRRFEGMGRTLARVQPNNGTTLWNAPRWAWRAYIANRLRLLCYLYRRNNGWLRALRDTARLHGLILETRQLHRKMTTRTV